MAYFIKMVTRPHLWPEYVQHYPTAATRNSPKWMNYKRQEDAECLTKGDKALVYFIKPIQRIFWAVEYLDIVKPKDYQAQLLTPQNLKLSDDRFQEHDGEKWCFFRPIKFLAWMDFEKEAKDEWRKVPTLARSKIPSLRKLGYTKRINQVKGGHIEISQETWLKMFNAMPWDEPK